MGVRERILGHIGVDLAEAKEIGGLLDKYRAEELLAFAGRVAGQLRGHCLECDGCAYELMRLAAVEAKLHGSDEKPSVTDAGEVHPMADN